MLSVFEYVLLGLAVFRLMRLVTFDQVTDRLRGFFQVKEENDLGDGTIEIIVSGRGKGIRHFIGEMLTCHWCVSVWSSVLLYVGLLFLPVVFMPIVMILSIAAVSSILQTIVNYYIEREDN